MKIKDLCILLLIFLIIVTGLDCIETTEITYDDFDGNEIEGTWQDRSDIKYKQIKMYEYGKYQYIGKEGKWINGDWVKEENNKITFYADIYLIKNRKEINNAILATGYVKDNKLILIPNKAYISDFIPSGTFEKLPSLTLNEVEEHTSEYHNVRYNGNIYPIGDTNFVTHETLDSNIYYPFFKNSDNSSDGYYFVNGKGQVFENLNNDYETYPIELTPYDLRIGAFDWDTWINEWQ